MSKQNCLRVLALMIIAAVQVGASCASSSSNDYNRSHQSHWDNDRPNRIPRSADMVREGTGKVKWTADIDGTCYIYDPRKERIVYEGPVRHGQEIVVLPDDDEVYVGGKVVSKQNLERHDRHQIYFGRQR